MHDLKKLKIFFDDFIFFFRFQTTIQFDDDDVFRCFDDFLHFHRSFHHRENYVIFEIYWYNICKNVQWKIQNKFCIDVINMIVNEWKIDFTQFVFYQNRHHFRTIDVFAKNVKKFHFVDSFNVFVFRTKISLKHLIYIKLIRWLKKSNKISNDFHELIYDENEMTFSILISWMMNRFVLS